MNFRIRKTTKKQSLPKVVFGLMLCTSLIAPNSLYAQQVNQPLPGPADVSRIIPKPERNLMDEPVKRPVLPKAAQQTPLPAEAEEITINLADVEVSGVTAFSYEEILKIYQPMLGKTLKLSEVWKLAEKITAYYTDHGYFLSRAYIPQQEIENGIIKINVVEGYIGKVVLDDPLINKRLVRELTQEITAQKPISAQKLEEVVLRLNDLPGHNFRSILKPLEGGAEGSTQLVLLPTEEKGRGVVTSGNSGSRFLGPWVNSVTYQTSLIDMQKTSFTVAASSQIDELRYGTVSHEITLTPKLTLGMTGNFVVANPGYTLRQNDIQSFSTELSTKLSYRQIRQWQRNLTYTLSLDGRNTNSNIFDTPLTRDRVRALRAGINYDFTDDNNNYNALNLTLSRGLSILSNSEEGELFLSRGQAKPDFNKIEASYKHQRYLPKKILATAQIAGQYSNQALYSSEEFGYGGQGFGRAYDNSEISGDRGISGSLELGYAGLPNTQRINVIPFVFYDIGKIWNVDRGSTPMSASSAGGGLHTMINGSVSLDFTIAQPLTKPQETPLYGNGKSPRFLLQMNAYF